MSNEFVTMKREVVQSAFDELLYANVGLKCRESLRTALEQPWVEPVAWGCNRFIEDDKGVQIGTDDPELHWGKHAPDDGNWFPLYTAPKPAQQPEADKLLRQALYVIEAWERDCDHGDYWRDRDDAITAIRKHLGDA